MSASSPTGPRSRRCPPRGGLLFSYCFDHGNHAFQDDLLVVTVTADIPVCAVGIVADNGAPADGAGVALVEPPVDAGGVEDVTALRDDLDAVVIDEGLEADGAIPFGLLPFLGAGVAHNGERRAIGGAGQDARETMARGAAAARARHGALPGAAAVGAEQDEAEHDGEEHHGRGRPRREVELGPTRRRGGRRVVARRCQASRVRRLDHVSGAGAGRVRDALSG